MTLKFLPNNWQKLCQTMRKVTVYAAGALGSQAGCRAACRQNRNRQPRRQKYIKSLPDRYTKSWKAKVLAAMPSDLMAADVRQLKTCAPILQALVAGAPDEEHQIWLQQQLQIIRRRLDQLRESWAQSQLRLVDASD